MNIYGLVNNAVQIVNSNTSAVWKMSTGYETQGDGSRVPSYKEIPVSAQIQASTGETLKQIEGLNVTGVVRSIYIQGNVQGIVRSDERGGDLLIFPQTPERNAQTWKVVTVVETWSTWAKVIAKLQ